MASRAIESSDRLRILAWFFSNGSLDDRSVMCLNQSIGDQFAERRQKRVRGLFRLDEFNAYRQVFPIAQVFPFRPMRAAVGAEARDGPDHAGAGYTALFEQREDLVVQEIVARGCILVKVNDYFSSQAGYEHAAPVPVLAMNARLSY
jgi:hypothetical protein